MAIGFLNDGPKFGDNRDLDLPNSDERRMQLAQRSTLSQIPGVNLSTDVATFVPASVLSMADTFLSSFGVIDDNALENWVIENTGGFGESVGRTQGAAQVVGDIGGLLIPATLASKAVRSTGLLGKAAEKYLGPNASKYFVSTGKSNKALFDESFQRAKALGTMRVKDLDAPGLGFQLARRKAIGRSLADTAIEGVAADAAIAASMNSSDFLFPDEMSLVDNLGWAAGTNLVATGVAGLIAKQVMRTGVRDAYASGRALSTTSADWVAQMSPSNIVGNRGAPIAVHSLLLGETQERLATARAASDGAAVTVAQEEIEGITGSLETLTRLSFQDSPIDGVTRSFAFKQGSTEFGPYLRTMQSAYSQDPQMAFGMRSLEVFDSTTPKEFTERFSDTIETVEVKLKINQEEIDSLLKQPLTTKREQKKLRRLRNQHDKLAAQIDDLSSTGATVVEVDGSYRGLAGREGIWHDGDRQILKFERAGSGIEFDNQMLLAGFDGKLMLGPRRKDITFDFDDESGQIFASENIVTWDTLTPNSVLTLYRGEGGRNTGSAVDGNWWTTNPTKAQRYGDVKTVQVPVSLLKGAARGHGGADEFLFPNGLPAEVAGQIKPANLASGGIIFSNAKNLDADGWRALSHVQKTGTFDALQSSAERLNINTWKGVELKGKQHFTQLDYLLRVVEKDPAQSKLALGKIVGVETVDDLRFASLASKFEEFQLLRNEASKAFAKGVDHPYSDLNNVARALNLPDTDSPILHLFESFRVADPNVLMKLEPIVKSMEGMETAIGKFMGIDPAAGPLAGIKYEGNMLNMPRDRKPVLAVMRNLENRAALSAEDLRAHVAQMRGVQAEKLRRATDTVIVKELMGVMDGMKDVVISFQKNLQNVVHGNSGFGLIERNFGQQPFRLRDEPAAQAINLFTDITEKQLDKTIERILKSPVQPGAKVTIQEQFNKLVGRGNDEHLTSFFTLRHALGMGWDLNQTKLFTRVASNASDKTGMYQAVLDPKSDHNKKLWSQIYNGEEMPTDRPVFLPLIDPKTKIASPVTITQMALDSALGMNNLSQLLLSEENALRSARNMKALSRKPFHLPPIDFSRANREYLFDMSGEFVAVVGADTKAELNKLVEQELEAAGGKLVRMTEADVERHHGARAEAFFKMVNFANPTNQTGQATGRSFGGVIRTGTNEFNGMLESILRGYSDIGRELRQLRLDPEIQYLRRMKRSSGLPDNKRTVYDEMLNLIAGTQNLDPTSAIGKLWNSGESVYDNMVQAVHDARVAAKETLGFTPLDNRRGTKLFGNTEKLLPGNLNPFKSVEDYLVRTNQMGVAPNLRKHGALINETAAALSLRAFEMGLAVINMLSLTTTLPPVIAAIAKRTGETDEAWRTRIGAFGTATNGGNGMFSPVKASITGTAYRYSAEGKAMIDRAAKRGLLAQAAAEQTEIWGRSGESFTVGKLRDFTNMVSKATDMTEVESRTIAFATMYKIGREGLGLQDNAAMVFAHQQANQVIADFRPSSRPAIFQGAVGMPLGLFTTYMWNYWQRIVSMVENKSARAGILQAGLQGSIFGAESLPGWDMYTGLFMENYDGSSTVVDRFNTAFGHLGADVFLNGSVSNLPRLFGASDGVSIGPRASVGVPFERGFGAQSAAGIQMIARVASTIGAGIDSTIEAGGIDPSRLGEIFATSGINKGLGNMTELALGHSVDYSGNIIEDDTRTMMGVASRVAGFKPLLTDELRQENVRNRATDRIQAELKGRLGDTLKSKIRNGRLEEEDVERALERYVRAGGNPESFRRFFQSQVQRATTTKRDLEILDALQGSIDEGRIGRLLYLSRD